MPRVLIGVIQPFYGEKMTDYSITLPSYSIGTQVYSKIEEICRPFGKTAVAVGGRRGIAAVKAQLLAATADTEIEITDFIWYGGEASEENITALAENEQVQNADMVFAIGGGKALDTCKACCERMHKPVFTFPTIASTCAATTAVSILYNSDGTFKAPEFHKAPPQHAFIYTPAIVQAPDKYIWAGMGDTYAKYFEAEMSSRNEALVHYHALGVNVSKMCLEPLLTYGKAAMADIRQNKTSYAAEQVILAIIVTTGIASILLTAEHIVDYNSGLAHAVFYALTAWEHIEKRHLHGEVVAFGVLILLLTDNNEEMFKTMYAFNRSVDLPTCLADIEMQPSDIPQLAKAAAKMKDIEHNPYSITEEMLLKAFEQLDYYNQKQIDKENEK